MAKKPKPTLPKLEDKTKLEDRKKEAKKEFKILRIAVYIALVIILGGVIGASIQIMIAAGSLDPDQTMMSLIYILSAGWMVAIVMIIPIIIARSEIWGKLKIFGRKSRVVIFRMIGSDANEVDVILPLKGNTIEIGESKLIINARKLTMKDGIKVITFVADNALAHDYFQNKTETLKALGERLSKNQNEDFHDIYSDPVRIDAKIYQETFLAAQQSNPDILKKIIAFLTSKNVIGILIVIAVLAGAAALFGLQTNNLFNTIPFCNPTTITP